MNFPSRSTGVPPERNKKYVVVDRRRYLPDGSISPSSPSNPWAVYEDTMPLIEPPLAEFESMAEALAHATMLGATSEPN
jgi:hypothetical protein